MISEVAECGGLQDKTEGYGVFCFDKCTRKTDFNKNVFGVSKLFCHKVKDLSTGMDECPTRNVQLHHHDWQQEQTSCDGWRRHMPQSI